MKEHYLWEIIDQTKEKAVDKNLTTDILIIGGGITGMSVAFSLRNSKYHVTVVDQNQCGHGVTMRTTGKLTYLQDDIYSKLTKAYDKETAYLYFKSQQEAIQIAKDNIEKYKIDCDFQELDSYLFVTDSKNEKKLEQEKEILQSFTEVEENEKLPISFPIEKAIQVKNTAVFHPLKYLLSLKKICKEAGISFYEDTMIEEITPKDNYFIASTGKHKIKAKQVVVCCHYPSFVMPFFTPFKTYLEKSYIGVIPNSKKEKISAINLDPEVYSFRSHKNHLLFLSETHKLSDDVNYLEKEQNLKKKIADHFQDEPLYLWSNYDLMTNDYLPFIGRIDEKHPNLYLATGFNTWGMTNGILSGKIIADLILEQKNPYIELFKPARSINMTKLKNDMVNDLNTTKIFVQTKIKKNYDFYGGNAKIVTRNGQKCGVYIDKDGKEHVVSNICPHMKCSLIFNPTTTTWDCPCHGSRFDIDGNVLKGPSTYSIKID